MSEKRMIIINSHLMRKIDEHRGQLSRSGFVDECVGKLLSGLELERPGAEIAVEAVEYVSKEDFERFERNVDRLQREFADFFIKYGRHLAGSTLSSEEAERFNDELKRLLQL